MAQKEISASEAIDLLSTETIGHLGTCDAGGQPYVTPLNFLYFRDRIYFHCAHEGRKLDNIAANSRVCFEVSRVDKNVFGPTACKCSTRYTSVLVFGRAKVVEDIPERREVLEALTVKFAAGRQYSSVSLEAAKTCTVVEISIDSIHGKKNVDPENQA